jgi:hypothetical protein
MCICCQDPISACVTASAIVSQHLLRLPCRPLSFLLPCSCHPNLQALADVLASPSSAAKSIGARADRRFFWNRVMAAPLLGELQGKGGLGGCCLMVVWFVKCTVGRMAEDCVLCVWKGGVESVAVWSVSARALVQVLSGICAVETCPWHVYTAAHCSNTAASVLRRCP